MFVSLSLINVVLYTLIDFANIGAPKVEKLPAVPEDLSNFQLAALRSGHVSEVALLDKRPTFARDETIIPQKSAEWLDDMGVAKLDDDEDDTKDDEKTDSTPMTLKVDVQVRDTMVKMIRFPKRKVSQALILQLDIITGVEMNSSTPLSVKARIAHVQAYQAMIAVENDKLSITVKDGVPKIISPFDITAEIKQYASKFDKSPYKWNAKKEDEPVSYGMSGRVEMAPMVMRFGYSDFDTLMSSLSAISPPKLEEDQSFVASPRGATSPLTDVDEQKQMEEGGDTASESSFSSEGREVLPSAKQQEMHDRLAEQRDKAKNVELPDQGEMEFAFRISEISLELVNDKV